jgi:hypothetical protein
MFSSLTSRFKTVYNTNIVLRVFLATAAQLVQLRVKKMASRNGK